MHKLRATLAGIAVCLLTASGQSLGGGATIDGIVLDQSGAAIPRAEVTLVNKVAGYKRASHTDERGAFRFANIPANRYHIEATAPGFDTLHQDVDVRSSVPLSLKLSLQVAGGTTSVTVEGSGADLTENVPYAHNDLENIGLSKLGDGSPASSLSDAITLGAPGVVADSNGFFHPLGDHAQVTFSIDGQPISDQQSKQFSTQVPLNALQSMEVITGAPPAEFGDKTSLIVNAITRSGLGLSRPTGSFTLGYGSYGTISEEGGLGLGNSKMGNYLVANAVRSGRFLDTPELSPIHAAGNNQTVFNRFDYLIDATQTLHVNVLTARNWFQIPNTYDQPGQDQRQKVVTYNLGTSYQRSFGANTLLSVDPFVRRDTVNYYPSGNPFLDTPATIDQQRQLTNWGLRADVSHVRRRQNFKFGAQLMQTRLKENFGLGITDPGFNAVCVDSAGAPQAAPGVGDPAGCAALGFIANPNFLPGLLPYDLTRNGSLFRFRDAGSVNQAAFYAQDSVAFRGVNAVAGVRVDRYSGLSQATSIQPRIGLSYLIRPAGTVLRAAYSRTLETPYNENLLLSSAATSGLAAGVFGAVAAEPLRPGRRNQFNAGLQRGIGHFLVVDADYFWKFTDNAYDFDTLFNTPIAFPISWRKSKIDGVAARLSTPNLRGFQGSTTIGHTRARFFGPENGGLIFNSPLDAAVFRIDHDQAFQQTTALRYQRPRNGAWVSLVWRYDSGLVAGSVTSLEDALALTGAQQAAIGFYCGNQYAAPGSPITACASPNYGATRLRIPAPGAANADHNPPRIAPRNLFDIGIGSDNLFHKDRLKITAKFAVLNVTNESALYNFLSTFSGTHFVPPRTYQTALGFTF